MLAIKKILFAAVTALFISTAYATDPCCNKMGGINYCDSSAGRLVCNNGFYSSCYCTRHAVMDLQLLMGCCLWRGGVSPNYTRTGLVVCNDGSFSEECSLQSPDERIAIY
ncbi:MAG: neurogenic locus notch [Legionella sp.]|nr:neurogenic locus notch [Legionella sp.]